MAKRYFNWKLAIVLVIAFAVLGSTAVGLRQWQKGRRAECGLEAGLKAYEQMKWEEAATNLGRYLMAKRDDVPILLKYADAQLKIMPLTPNKVQQAIASYRAILRMDKDNSEAAMRLTETYLATMGAPGEAELVARRQVEINADPELRRLLALALARQRKFDEAATELKGVIEEHPEQVLAYETLGQLTEQRPEDFPDPPEHWFNLAVKNNPSTALAYIIRARFNRRSKNMPQVLADLEQAEKQDLSDPAVRLQLANELINTNVLDKAEKHLTAVQKAMPTDQTLWHTWAQLALKSRSQEKMLKIAEAGLTELSSYPWAFMSTAAELFMWGGKLDRATDCVSRLRQKNMAPDFVACLEGLVASEKGQLFEAVKCWRRAAELGNRSPQIRLLLARALSRLGDTQSAPRQLRGLVSERPDFFDGRLELARLLAQTGNWSEASQHARAAMQLEPENLEAALLHLQARIYLLAESPSGENTQMWQDVQEELARLESTTDGAAEVKFVQLQLAVQQGNFPEAEVLVKRLKKDHLPQAKIAIAEAELLAVQAKTSEAISILRATTKEYPEAVEPVKYLASLLAQQGNYKEAEDTLEAALARVEQPIAQRDLGLLLAQIHTVSGKPDNAYKLLTRLAQKLPSDIPLKRRLLACEQVTKDSGQAQQIIDEIKSLEGEDGWQWKYEQARVWLGTDDFKGRYPQIVPLLQKNLLANPDDQASRMLLAAAYERAGELQLAVSTYRDALRRSPDNIGVIVRAVTALYNAQEHNEVEEILDRASQQKLYHPQLQTLRYQSYLRRGELSSASDILQDLLGNDPNNPAVCFSLALLKMRQNRFDEADKLLAKLKVRDPNSLPVTAAQVQLNVSQNRPEEAMRLCNEAVDNLGNASAYILRAKTCAMLGQTDRAIEDFGRAIAVEPKNAEVWVARSDLYRTSGREVEAVADIRQALSLAPDNSRVQKLAIQLLMGSRNPDTVRQGKIILDKALESSPQDIELQMLKARSLLVEGTAPAGEDAEQILQKITEDRPETVEAWVLLGAVLLRQQQSGRALDAALRGLAHKPNDKTLLLLKARAEAARSPILAIPTLKELREQDPNDADIALYLANTYAEVGEPEKAVNLLKEQLTLCKGASQQRKVRIALAVALYQNGEKVDAQKEFDSLLQSAPDDPAPLLAEARLLANDNLWSQLSEKVTQWSNNHPQDNYTLLTIAGALATSEEDHAKRISEKLLCRILDRDPNNLEAMNTLAMLLQTIGRGAESAKLYQHILRLKPNSVIAINNLAWIMCEEQGKYQQALELAQRGLKIAPWYIDLIDTRGIVYYRLGQFDKAIQDFTTCIELYPSAAPLGVASRFHLARACARLGQTNKAIEHLSQALDLDSRIGGLSTADLAEARSLSEQLRAGS